MGSDDLFKKRKARKLRDISRKKRTRELYKRVLIVCEGQKTEPSFCVKLVCDISSIFVSYFTFLNVTAFFSFFSKRGCGGKSFFFFFTPLP